MLLRRLLKDAGKNQQWLAGKMDVDEAIISNFNTTDRLPWKEETVYKHMLTMFPHLISEHVVTSSDQARELINKIPFKYEKQLAQKFRDTLESEVLELIKKQQALDRPWYKTKWGTELIGRHKDIEAIFTMLQGEHGDYRKGAQFFTLAGIPGVGKTEIALQIERLAPQRGFTNVKFIPLDQVKHSEEMLKKIDDYLQSIDAGQLTLLILDNCDDIEDIERARREVYSLVRKNALLFILATSRIAFSSNRDEYKVKPLAVPAYKEEALTKLLENDTVRLFLEEVKPIVTLNERNSQAIASLCIAFGGLPEAVKIAAPLVRLKGEEEIRSLLKDIENRTFLQTRNTEADDKRKDTLYKVIAISYTRLGEDGYIFEQKLLSRLGIFVGRCSKASLLAVCNLNNDLPTNEDNPVLENALNTLAFHNLIVFEEHKQIRIAHATIRDFALDIMTDEEREAIRRQYIDYYYLLQFDAEMKKRLDDEWDDMFNAVDIIIPEIQRKYVDDQIIKALGEGAFQETLSLWDKLQQAGYEGITAEEKEKLNRFVDIHNEIVPITRVYWVENFPYPHNIYSPSKRYYYPPHLPLEAVGEAEFLVEDIRNSYPQVIIKDYYKYYTTSNYLTSTALSWIESQSKNYEHTDHYIPDNIPLNNVL